MKENDFLLAQLREDAVIPSKRLEDAGYDVYACFEEEYMVIEPGETKLVPTGIASALHPSKCVILQERGSTGSIALKKGAGIIDSGYRNEWFVALTNCSNLSIVISKIPEEEILERLKGEYLVDKDGTTHWMISDDSQFGMRKLFKLYPYTKAIAQAIVTEVPVMEVKEISYEELKAIPSERGMGALGSSGK